VVCEQGLRASALCECARVTASRKALDVRPNFAFNNSRTRIYRRFHSSVVTYSAMEDAVEVRESSDRALTRTQRMDALSSKFSAHNLPLDV
jgi:hypothetical protein